MSSSDDTPSILLSDDRETVFEKIRSHAYSSGQSTIEAHREQGGDPERDSSFRFLSYFFEENDERLERLAREYRNGSMLSGELKEITATKIADFLEHHQERRKQLGSLLDELPAYRLSDTERQRALHKTGFQDDGLIQR